MNKKIKVIELINKIYANLDVPEKVKYKDIEYFYKENVQDYKPLIKSSCIYLFDKILTEEKWLDAEVEIIEDEEEIEKIKEIEVDNNSYIVTDNRTNLKGRAIDITFVNKINEIIKKVNELDKKINKED